MHGSGPPVLRDIVLVGGGHSHVGVLKRLGMRPIPGVRLTVICQDAHTPYSGMLPGYIAGHYSYDDVHIDLRRLCQFAGARFYRAEADGIDRQQQRVRCKGRPEVPYDLLSINIGSTPQLHQVEGAAAHAVPVKPIQRFNRRWQEVLERVRERAGPIRIAVVGGGAGGVELALAMQYRLSRELAAQGRDPGELEIELFNAAAQILPTHNRRVRAAFERRLAERGVAVRNRAAVVQVGERCLRVSDGESVTADEIVWVTQAGGASWLAGTGLELDAEGFLCVRDTLQTTADDRIFAAGDIAHVVNHPRPKAGVFAVRQGPPLARNLRRMVRGRRPRPFRPQRDWLALISTGDRNAVASRGRFIGVEGAWVWRWKDWIDRRFMARFTDLPAKGDGR